MSLIRKANFPAAPLTSEVFNVLFEHSPRTACSRPNSSGVGMQRNRWRTLERSGRQLGRHRLPAAAASPADTTSILKLLTKDVTIGSTVDPANGDKGPRAVTVVQGSGGKLKKGQLLVCNFEDSSGTPATERRSNSSVQRPARSRRPSFKIVRLRDATVLRSVVTARSPTLPDSPAR